METIRKILGRIVGDIKNKGEGREDIDSLWQHSVSKQLGQHTRPRRLKGRILYVVAENPAWLSDARMQQARIEKKLAHLSHNAIKTFRVSVGDIYGQ